MKEFEANVVIVCMILGAIIFGLGLIFAKEKVEENNIVVEEGENWN